MEICFEDMILFIIVITAGLFGGLLRVLLSGSQEKKVKTIFVSVLSATLTPVFLYIILRADELFQNLDMYKYLIIWGFCLLASIASDGFIRMLCSKSLSVDLGKEIEQINKKLDTIEQDCIEPNWAAIDYGENSSDMETLKIAFVKSRYKYRGIKGLENDSGLSSGRISSLLKILKKNHEVDEITDKDNILKYKLVSPFIHISQREVKLDYTGTPQPINIWANVPYEIKEAPNSNNSH